MEILFLAHFECLKYDILWTIILFLIIQLQITYTADENGFQAAGDALPTQVPLPEENLRAIAEHEAALATG